MLRDYNFDSRAGYPRFSAATVQETEKDTNGVQSLATPETGTRLREESLCRGG